MDRTREKEYILAGSFRASAEKRNIMEPGAGGEVIARVHLAGETEVEEAAAAACKAFESTRNLPTYIRVEACRHVARRLEEESEGFAEDLAREAGKPISLARAEVQRAILTFTTASEEASRVGGEVLKLDVAPDAVGVLGMVRRFPIGPVAAITPFNFPLNLVAHKLAPAVAAGCPVVLKPASATPLSALNLGELLLETEYPKIAVSILPCSAETAAPLVEDDRFRLITFTGSAEVGWRIKNRAGKKRVALELGGNAAAVIDATADLDFASQRLALGAFAYAGQSCISTQRVYVHNSVLDVFLAKFLGEVEEIKVGYPMDPTAVVGPMITLEDASRVEAWVSEAVEGGARILIGGVRDGFYYHPTVLSGTDPAMKVVCKEVFGPVVVVEPFEDWAEAIDKVNDSDYGLQAAVFTKDIDNVLRAWADIDVGGLVVNDMPTYRVDPQPYGGVKNSGMGREGPRFAIEEMTEQRVLLIRSRR